MSPKPLFSILIANYNNGSYLEECLQSIFNQTYENWEIVVVDDGSLDISNNIYDKNKGHEKITVYRNRRNKGCGYTKRKCIDLAKGEICGFVDPDDAITPDALEIMVEAHAQLKLHGLIYSNHYICDENLRIVKEADYVGQIPKDVKSWAIRIPTISQFATFKSAFIISPREYAIYIKRLWTKISILSWKILLQFNTSTSHYIIIVTIPGAFLSARVQA